MENNYSVLLFEGRARQSLPLARAFDLLGCNVYALCSSKLDVAYVSKHVHHPIIARRSSEETTVENIISVLKNNRIDLIVPTTDFAACILSKHKRKFVKYSKCAICDAAIFDIALDKNKTMEVCERIGVPHPKTIQDIRSVNQLLNTGFSFPIVMKPSIGYGAIGFKVIHNLEELKTEVDRIDNKINKYVFQEYIPQTELHYTCEMFLDGKGEVKTAVVSSKNRWYPIHGGASTLSITVDRPDIVDSCTRLLKEIHWSGAADIDLIQDPRDARAKIIEINPRVSGNVKNCFEAGVNQALQMKQMALDEDVTEFLEYPVGQRLRCIQTDILWFIKSKNRFLTEPSWFSLKNTKDQIFYYDDPLPFFAFSINGMIHYKKEMDKRS